MSKWKKLFMLYLKHTKFIHQEQQPTVEKKRTPRIFHYKNSNCNNKHNWTTEKKILRHTKKLKSKHGERERDAFLWCTSAVVGVRRSFFFFACYYNVVLLLSLLLCELFVRWKKYKKLWFSVWRLHANAFFVALFVFSFSLFSPLINSNVFGFIEKDNWIDTQCRVSDASLIGLS